MNWGEIGKIVGKAAPIVGSLLGGPAGGAVGAMVSKALGADNTPDAVSQALQSNPDALAKIIALENDNIQKLTQMHLDAETARLTQINTTMRAEAASNDAYVRRWRPTFGYLTAIAWLIEAGAIAWSIVGSPAEAGSVAQAVTALTPMWGVALAVLGVNIASRSKDKQVAAGQTPPDGLIASISKRIAP